MSIAKPLSLMSAFIVFVDATIVNLALPSMELELRATRPQLEWVVNAYTLSFAATMLCAGALADAAGPKRTFTLGITTFLIASALCALAGGADLLNFSRLIQGIGAALVLPSSLKLATEAASSEHDRQRIVGAWAAAGGAGLAAGPLLGGLLVSTFAWPSIFWVNAVLCLPMVLAAHFGLSTAKGGTGFDSLDVAGQATASLAIGALVYILIEAPSRDWSDGPILVAAVTMLLASIAFIAAERHAKAPLLPTDVYRNHVFNLSAAQGALFNFMFYGVLFAFSYEFQVGLGLSPILSGIGFLPMMGGVIFGNLLAPRLAIRRGRLRVLRTGQFALLISLLLLLLSTHLHSPLWLCLVLLFPTGLAAGLLVPTMTSQTLSTVSPALHGVASAAFNTARQVGGAIGVAAFGPLLGIATDLDTGFLICLALASAAMALSLLLTKLICRQSPSGCDHVYKR